MNDQNGVSDQRREMRFGPAICTRSAATAIESLKGVYRRLFRLNFGVVERGRVYRSASPGENLSRLMKTYRLASILDLEGVPGLALGASPNFASPAAGSSATSGSRFHSDAGPCAKSCSP